MTRFKNIKLAYLTFFVLLTTVSSFAQEQKQTDSIKSKSSSLGPSSVGGQIDKDQTVESKLLKNYFDFKDNFETKSNFSYGVDYFSNFQVATASLGDNSAFSGVFRVYGNWNLIGKKSGNNGALVFKVENRHAYGNNIPGQSLGGEIGYIGLTSTPFSDIHWALTNFYWLQEFAQGKIKFALGQVDATDYFNIYALVDPWNDFSNLQFSTGVTIPAPNQGLGAMIQGRLTKNYYVMAGISDANGSPTEPLDGFDSFFKVAEYFTLAEFGWVKSYQERFTDNIHLSFWHVANREALNIPSGWGLNFSYSRLFKEQWQPFLRAGYAKNGGALYEGSIEAGVGYKFSPKQNLVGIGLGWGQPSESTFYEGVEDQLTIELFYHWQKLKTLILTPDVQFIINPAQNPTSNFITVFGLRGRIFI